MSATPLDSAIANLLTDIEMGELPRIVDGDPDTLDAIRYVFQQWYAVTDNAGLEYTATAEEIARTYFDRGTNPDDWEWAPSAP